MNQFNNVYFINGTAYAGKSTMVKMLAEKYNGIACKKIIKMLNCGNWIVVSFQA